jgi:hypothetical protein
MAVECMIYLGLRQLGKYPICSVQQRVSAGERSTLGDSTGPDRGRAALEQCMHRLSIGELVEPVESYPFVQHISLAI